MDYIQTAKEIVEQIAAAGAQGEAYFEIGSESHVEVNRGKVEKLSHAGSKGLGIRAILNGKMGYAYTSDFSPSSLEKTRRAALELAQVTDADPFRALPEPQIVPPAELDIFDPMVAAMRMEDKVAFALETEKAALEYDSRIVMTNNCTYMDGMATVYLVNSLGFAGSYQKTFLAAYLFAIAREGEDTVMGLGLGASTHRQDVDPVAIGREAGQKAIRLLGGKPVPTQEATVVLDPLAAAELIGSLGSALTAEAMQRQRSFLIGKLGQEVASDMVTLLDNARLPRGFGSAPFDGEGVPTGATRLIDEGILQGVIYDTYTARKDGKSSTGNAARGSHRSLPRLSASNLYLQPGKQSPEEIIAGVERGLYVLNTMNVGGINPVSGDYSVAASGLWIENGRLTRPVNEVTIAMPLEKLLKHITAIGNDLRFLPFGGSIGAPTIRIDGMTIGGKADE